MLHQVQCKHSNHPSPTAATSSTAYPERPHLLQEEISCMCFGLHTGHSTCTFFLFVLVWFWWVFFFWGGRIGFFSCFSGGFFISFQPQSVAQVGVYCVVTGASLGSKASNGGTLPTIYSLFPGCYFEPANQFQPYLTEVSKKSNWKSAAVYAVLITQSFMHASGWQPAVHQHASTNKFRHRSETTPAVGVFSPGQWRRAWGRCNHLQRVYAVGLLGYKTQNCDLLLVIPKRLREAFFSYLDDQYNNNSNK